MNKTTTGFDFVVCMRTTVVLLLCALSIILLTSVLLTFCIQNEYIDITSIGIIRVIIYIVIGLTCGCVLFAGRREGSIWNILTSLIAFVIIDLALSCLIYDRITMEWGWGIISMFSGIFVTYMVQNHRKVRLKKMPAKYRAR